MAEKVKVWFVPRKEIVWKYSSRMPLAMRPTAHEAVMERVDEQGQVLGFSILGVSRVQKDHPLEDGTCQWGIKMAKAFSHPKKTPPFFSILSHPHQ